MLSPKHEINKALIREKILNFGKKKKTSISLDDKVDEFINWVFATVANDAYLSTQAERRSIEMRNFIEKMAVWYELRYPDYEINPGSTQDNIDVDDVMFNSNRYINASLDKDSDVRVLAWDEFYNAEAFINSLPLKEKSLFHTPGYSTLVYVDLTHSSAHLHLTSDGIVEEAEGLGAYSGYIISDKSLQGMHIKDVVQLLKENGVALPSDNELEATINNIDNWVYQKEEMLNCVLYRLIERGGNIIGPRRAFLFAKEFGRNIDIPMMYGVDYSDPRLRIFINEYIKAGGNPNLDCYVGYFSRASKDEETDVVSVQELIQTIPNDSTTKYTPEEIDLQQRLVNVLASQIDNEELKKEEVQQLRLQRKLEKSRKKYNK